jgi:hypothetical protein
VASGDALTSSLAQGIGEQSNVSKRRRLDRKPQDHDLDRPVKTKNHGVAAPERKRGMVDDHQTLARQTANSLVNFFGAAAFCSFT